MDSIKQYFRNWAIWITQGINVLLAGNPDEATSSRAYRLQDRWFWGKLREFIDWIFGEGHCLRAYTAELRRVSAWER